ncbi:ribonuclease HII, partial [Embleya sp. NPDC059259]|uniref:ribonuclease HII n=1 Tax=Embleya sp. NPDC059259 TaxID=3346796 RepID=UPI003680EA25
MKQPNTEQAGGPGIEPERAAAAPTTVRRAAAGRTVALPDSGGASAAKKAVAGRAVAKKAVAKKVAGRKVAAEKVVAPRRPAARIAPPSYDVERELIAGGARVVAGVDEVGRGAWAGPVLVAAAITDLSVPPTGLTDSKLLTAARREEVAAAVAPWVRAYAFGSASPEEIDTLGMTAALRLSAERALGALPVRPDAIVLDGKHDFLGTPWTVRCVIKGDQSCIGVAAASVLAKVHRDALMAEIGAAFP